MKLGAAAVAICLLAVASAGAKDQPVLGWDYGQKRLAWFDPATLAPLAGRKVPMREGACTWSFSPNAARLAYSGCNGTITIVNARTMRAEGDVLVTSELGSASSLAWPRADRLLATGQRDDDPKLVAIDPLRRRVLRVVDLPGPASSRTLLRDGRVAYLIGNSGSVAPARVAVADADANVRTVTIDRISTGSIVDEDAGDYEGVTRGVGFAVDTLGNRAFVVSPELLVAEVDLATLAVAYHGPTRALSKFVDGPQRHAAWLGDGILAVSGADYSTTGTGTARHTTSTPYGLHFVDTTTWTVRTIDPAASWFQRGPSLVLVGPADGAVAREVVAWGVDGTEHYRVRLKARTWLNVYGDLGYVCENDRLVRIVSAVSGAARATPRSRSCVQLLDGPSSAP